MIKNKVKLIVLVVLIISGMLSVTGYTQSDFWVDSYEFLRLRDAPEEHDYNGQAGNFVRVNSNEDALEFVAFDHYVACIVTHNGDVVTHNGEVVYHCE